MKYLTTAQRLAAYRDELQEAGFDEPTTGDLINFAAPRNLDDVEVQADLDDTAESLGEVRVRMVPRLDEDDLKRVAERVHNTVDEAGRR
ncbi:hypothetical protein BJF79_03720 [Actinomadura sp. CNU-125]|uniref:hypothetical protein n=1 Tax=Actinomadura sp. CNU-125 TaxID=1904961 RepID=UPI0009597CA0|nr:hypothetical protein [Actinomadura sp. CNU-125]OLT13018.1 hypothetical protein BJF79_03720 [Actinomadura sp. CNU-125]